MEDVMEQSQQPQPEQKDEHDDIDTGSEFVSRADIVLVQPFNPNENPQIRARGTHTCRVVLFERSFLAPTTPQEFIEKHGFVSLAEDGVALNPDHLGRRPGQNDDTLHVRRFVQDPSKPRFKEDYKSELFWTGGFIRLKTDPLVLRALLRVKKAEPAPAEGSPPTEGPAQPKPPQRRRRGLSFTP
jgi:hypothetical protein